MPALGNQTMYSQNINLSLYGGMARSAERKRHQIGHKLTISTAESLASFVVWSTYTRATAFSPGQV